MPVTYLDEEKANIEIPESSDGSPKFLSPDELNRQNQLSQQKRKISYLEDTPHVNPYEEALKVQARNDQIKKAMAVQQIKAVIQKKQQDENPANWSSIRFKKDAPKPKTIEEAAQYNAILAHKKAKEDEMADALLPPELRKQKPLEIKGSSAARKITYLDQNNNIPVHLVEKVREPILNPLIRKIGALAGIPESIPVPRPDQISEGGSPVLGGVAKTAEDITAISSEFLNQFFMNFPKSIARKAGYDLPEAESTAGKAAQIAAGIAGAIKNPIFEVMGVGPGASLPKLMRAGATYGALYAPTDNPVGISERTGQAAIGAVLPLAEAGISKTLQGISPMLKKGAVRIVNSLIKPLLKDFSYGRNPGLSIAKEGITANNFDSLIEKINAAKNRTGEKIFRTLSDPKYAPIRIDISKDLTPLDDAMNVAAKQNNQYLLTRLQAVKKAITENLGIAEEKGKKIIVSLGKKNLNSLSPLEATQIKIEIGDLTKWTGDPSNDKAVNKALKTVYGKIKEKIETVVPEIKNTNEHYANLLSAEIATKYRDKIVARQNILGLVPKYAVYTGVLAGFLSGNPKIFIESLAAVGVEKAVSSIAFKTRVAAGMFKMSESELADILLQYPKLQNFAWKLFKGLQGKGNQEETELVQKSIKLIGKNDLKLLEGPSNKRLGVSEKFGEGFERNTKEEAYKKILEFASKYWNPTEKKLMIPEGEIFSKKDITFLKKFQINPFTGEIKSPKLKSAFEIAWKNAKSKDIYKKYFPNRSA